MIRLLILLLLLPLLTWGQSPDATLTAENLNEIKNKVYSTTRAWQFNQDMIDSKVSILVPRLTASSVNGYVWTAVGTSGLGAWTVLPASGVTSVSGTANRITSTGGATPVIDISGSYVGQSSITTLGTIGTGIWNGSVVSPVYGGTGIANNALSTITVSGNFGTTFTVTGTTGVTLPTSGTLVNTAVTTLSSLVSVGTITTGTWSGTTIGVTKGGTGLTSISTGQLIYGSGANAISALAVPGGTGKLLQSTSSTAFGWSSILWPTTAATADLFYASSPTIISRLATAGVSNQILTTNGGSFTPSWGALQSGNGTTANGLKFDLGGNITTDVSLLFVNPGVLTQFSLSTSGSNGALFLIESADQTNGGLELLSTNTAATEEVAFVLDVGNVIGDGFVAGFADDRTVKKSIELYVAGTGLGLTDFSGFTAYSLVPKGYVTANFQVLDADLTAIAALSSTGILARTASNTWAQRTITGTSSRLTVTNGDGVSGNPTLDISTSYAGQSTIVTTGTLTGGATGAGFTLALGTSTLTGDLPFANLTQIAGLSVLGVTGSSTADVAAITAGADYNVLRRASSSSVGFGSIDLSQSGAVGSSILAGANGGTGVANTGFTITLAGNLITTGAFNTTFTAAATATFTLPSATGTLAALNGSNTWTNTQTFNGTSTTGAPIVVSFANNPSSPATGSIWFNNVNSTFYYRTGAVSRIVVDAGSAGITSQQVVFGSAASSTVGQSANFTFVTNRISGTTLYATFSAGSTAAGTGPIKMTSSGSGVTGLMTTAEAGVFEFTDRGLWFSPAASTRHKVWAGLVGAAAPGTNSIGVVVDYYGTSATRVLTTPTTWISIVGDDGTTYKVPAY